MQGGNAASVRREVETNAASIATAFENQLDSLFAADALDLLKRRGCRQIRLMCLVAAPEGVRRVRQAHPDVDIYTAALDQGLDDRAYIVPGLGDAGDRIFGTL